MIKKIISSALISLSILFAGQSFCEDSAQSKLKIVSYNVENLFDTKHDEGKDDWEFLPKGYPGREEACSKSQNKKRCLEHDWNDKHLEVKLFQITRVLNAISNPSPDIVLLAEIENANVVSKLAAASGYEAKNIVVSNSPDVRGIDLAVMFRPGTNLAVKEKGFREIKVEGTGLQKPTRNILEVEFKVFGDKQLFVYVNHWPSQASKTPARKVAAETLRAAMQERLKQNPDAYIVAAGDFNTLDTELPSPFSSLVIRGLTAGLTQPDATKPAFLYDLHSYFVSSPEISKEAKAKLPRGSYYYGSDKVWNRFDRFLVSKNLVGTNSGVRIDVPSYQIFSQPFMTHTIQKSNEVVPNRYDHDAIDPDKAGFSDHFPIVLDIVK